MTTAWDKGGGALTRYACPGPAGPVPFDDDTLAALRAAGLEAADARLRWGAGRHPLDADFALDQNVAEAHLLADLAWTEERPPAALRQAYEAQELTGVARPAPRQKAEAKRAAAERLAAEGKDGRFRRHGSLPVCWAAGRNELWTRGGSGPAADRLVRLIQATPGLKTGELTTLTADTLAARLLPGTDLEAVTPTRFVEGPDVTDGPAWCRGAADRRYLGNEFLLWLWREADAAGVVGTAAGPVTVMLTRTLTLDCPRGQTGTQVITHLGPTSAPEARRGLRAGKLPRAAGLTLAADGDDGLFEAVLQAETFALRGVRLPPPAEGLDPFARRLDRLAARGRLLDAVDGLYAAFLALRLGPDWADAAESLRDWVAAGDRPRPPA